MNLFFAQPVALLWLGILFMLGLVLAWRQLVRQRKLAQLATGDALQRVIRGLRHWAYWVRLLFWHTAMACFIVALAEPAWSFVAEDNSTPARNLIIALDVSRSMDAQDIAPSRLERIKADLTLWLPTLQNTQVALIIFTSEALTYLPLTYDLNTALVFIQQLTTQTLSIQGTSFDAALAELLRTVGDLPPKSSHVLLLSDGENHEAIASQRWESLAVLDFSLTVLGVGTSEGATIPRYAPDGSLVGYQQDAQGTLVVSQLDETVLQQLATATNGFYQRFNGLASLQPLTEVLETLQPLSQAQQSTLRPIIQANIVIALGFGFLILGYFIPLRRRAS